MSPTLFVSPKGEVQTEFRFSPSSGFWEKERDGEDVSKCLAMLLSDEAGVSPAILLQQMLGTGHSALAWDWDMLSRETENKPEPRVLLVDTTTVSLHRCSYYRIRILLSLKISASFSCVPCGL